MEFKAGVLTISDKGSRGERVDESGKVAIEILNNNGFTVIKSEIVPDNIRSISNTLIKWIEDDFRRHRVKPHRRNSPGDEESH